MSLATSYLGLDLKNPLVPSASPLTRNLDMAKRLEDAGAAALIMHSLFEEEIISEDDEIEQHWGGQDSGTIEPETFLSEHYDFRTTRESYLEQIEALKSSLDIPVIASLNGVTSGGWTEQAKAIQDAGADALELNIYFIAADRYQSSQEIEDRYINILKLIKEEIYLPVSLKLSQQFTSPLYFIKQLELAGADGVALFNRYFHPDIDINKKQILRKLELSSPYESLERLHWIALLYQHVKLTLAATGGIHHGDEVIKMLLAGADVVHLCTALLNNGPKLINKLIEDLENWMDHNEYESLQQLRGKLCYSNITDKAAFERANYLQTIKQGSDRYS